MNLKLVLMKASIHLLNVTEVTTCRNGVETFHVEMLSGHISNSGQTLIQNLLFFIIQDCVKRRKASFHDKVLNW